MSALSISESAVSRALGMYDIVALIARFSQVYQPTGDLQAHWEGSGLLARGVNRLWKEVHDKHIISQMKDAKGTLRLVRHSQSQALPLPILSMLSQPDWTLPGLRAIRATSSYISSWDRQHTMLLVHLGSKLASLSLDKFALLALSKAYAADKTIAFPSLVSLHLLLHTGRGTRYLNEREFGLHVPLFVRSLNKLKTLTLYPESDPNDSTGRIHVNCVNVLLSISKAHVETIRLRPRNVKPGALPDLATIMLHYSGLTHLLISVPFANSWLLSPDITPLDLDYLEYEISPRLVPSLLELLANPAFLPKVRAVPVVTLVSGGTPVSRMPCKPKVTMLMVERAIRGLKERGSIDNVHKAAEKLYELVNDFPSGEYQPV